MNTNKANGNDSSNHSQNHSLKNDCGNHSLNLVGGGLEPGLDSTLRNFRASVHAWSEAELSRPRTIQVVHRHSWRFAAAWALGCVLAVGSLSAGLFQHHRNQMLAITAQQRQMHQEQLQTSQVAAVNEQAGQGDESLMAGVDSDVSRPVPSAMEPLAQLMDEGADQ
jgi:hypothetical protein